MLHFGYTSRLVMVYCIYSRNTGHHHISVFKLYQYFHISLVFAYTKATTLYLTTKRLRHSSNIPNILTNFILLSSH